MQKTISLFALAAIVFPLLVSAETPGTITIDNRNAELHPAGAWEAKTPSRDKYGDDYAFANGADNQDKKATATFRPKIPAAGRYDISIMYPSGSNRSAKSQWHISFDGGQTNLTVNQQSNNGIGKWVPLAKNIPFAAGTSGFVRLDNMGGVGVVVVADAVQFTPLTPAVAAGKTYNLTATATPGGTVERNPDTSAPAADSRVVLTVKPNAGYVFDGWTGSVTGFKNPLKLLMNTNKTITANFIPAGIGLIMDNPDADFTPTWKLSQTNWGGARYEDYQFASAKAKADYFANYKPNIPKTGKYDVYIWYANGGNRSAKVPWIVHNKDGATKTTINQQRAGGEWVPIASGISFEAGKHDRQYVEVNNGTGETTSGMVIADAVAFVYVGD